MLHVNLLLEKILLYCDNLPLGVGMVREDTAVIKYNDMLSWIMLFNKLFTSKEFFV